MSGIPDLKASADVRSEAHRSSRASFSRLGCLRAAAAAAITAFFGLHNLTSSFRQFALHFEFRRSSNWRWPVFGLFAGLAPLEAEDEDLEAGEDPVGVLEDEDSGNGAISD